MEKEYVCKKHLKLVIIKRHYEENEQANHSEEPKYFTLYRYKKLYPEYTHKNFYNPVIDRQITKNIFNRIFDIGLKNTVSF